MKGDTQLLAQLNNILTHELTSMDVYFVQSRMCERWGYTKIFERLNHEISDERLHAELLVKRILLLEGTPDLASREPFKVGANVEEMLRADLALELDVRDRLQAAIRLSVDVGDNGTRLILQKLLEDTEEDHINWIETQLHLIEELGLEVYLHEQL